MQAFYYADGVPTKGKWFDLDTLTSVDDVLDEFTRAGLTPKNYGGDLLVADIEGDLARCFYSSRSDFFDLDSFMDCRDQCQDENAAAAFIDYFGSWDRQAFESAYMGHYASAEAFAEQYIDDSGLLSEVPEHLQCYFDVERFARDLFLGDYWISDSGYVFSSNC
jgi:Antirestriction protein (ArdA)